MRPLLPSGLLVVAVVSAGCAAPSQTPTPSVQAPAGHALPAGISGIPRPGDVTAIIAPQTVRGSLQPGIEMRFQLGHCGLISPIDFDGALWDPVAGHDGFGGPLDEDQVGELINSTAVALVLVEPDLAELRTPRQAVVTLVRHVGGRPYNLCD